MSRAGKPFILPLTSGHSGVTRACTRRSRSPSEHESDFSRAVVRPILGNIYHGQVQYFQQTVIGEESGFGHIYFEQLTIEAFNGIGGIDRLLDLLKEYCVDDHIDFHKAIRTDNENALYTAIFWTVQYSCPEFRQPSSRSAPHCGRWYPEIPLHRWIPEVTTTTF